MAADTKKWKYSCLLSFNWYWLYSFYIAYPEYLLSMVVICFPLVIWNSSAYSIRLLFWDLDFITPLRHTVINCDILRNTRHILSINSVLLIVNHDIWFIINTFVPVILAVEKATRHLVDIVQQHCKSLPNCLSASWITITLQYLKKLKLNSSHTTIKI